MTKAGNEVASLTSEAIHQQKKAGPSVAIDNDWTRPRFRQVGFIKTMKRNSSLP